MFSATAGWTVVFIIRRIKLGAGSGPVIVFLGAGSSLAFQGSCPGEGGFDGLLLRQAVERIRRLSSGRRRGRLGGVGWLSQYLEVWILGLSIERGGRNTTAAFKGDHFARHAFGGGRFRDSYCGHGRRGGENLALRRGAVLRRNIGRAFVIGRWLVKSLEFTLQLSLTFLGRLQFDTLSCKNSFLFFGFATSFFPTAFLFLLLDLALADLFLKCTKASGLGILFLLEFQLALTGLAPVNVLANSNYFLFVSSRLLTLDAWSPPPELLAFP